MGTEEGVDGGRTIEGGDENTPPANMEEARERSSLQEINPTGINLCRKECYKLSWV